MKKATVLTVSMLHRSFLRTDKAVTCKIGPFRRRERYDHLVKVKSTVGV